MHNSGCYLSRRMYSFLAVGSFQDVGLIFNSYNSHHWLISSCSCFQDETIRATTFLAACIILAATFLVAGTPWTEEEHRKFLLGLQKFGKGDWRGISRNYVPSRTPTQVASHAQKYFIRQSNTGRRKKRSSLFDMAPDMETFSSLTPEQCSSQSQVINIDNEKHIVSSSHVTASSLPSLALSLKPASLPLPFQLWPPNASSEARSSHRSLKRAQSSSTVKQDFDATLMVGKTYVVFIGRKPGVYETWEEAHSQVNKFSGASHKSFWSKDEATKAFHAYIEKQHSTTSFTSDGESSGATFSASSNRTSECEKLVKLKDLILDLENENRNHVLRVAGIAEEIKQLVNSLQISGDD